MNYRERLDIGHCGRTSGALADFANDKKFARPGSKPFYAPDQNFDAEHILLELDIDFAREVMSGKCTSTVSAINDRAREVKFHAAQMKVLSVNDGLGVKLNFTHKGEHLSVHLPRALKESERADVVIRYRVSKPQAGLYFIKPDSHYPRKAVQLWTHAETEEARYWFPCFDAPHDKATTEMIVSVPKNFFALSNGALLSVNERGPKKTFHWRQAVAHSPYLVTLVAGKFSEIADEWSGIPIQYYCEPGREEDTRRAFGKTPKMVKFFSESIGVKYPYEKYAQIAVSDFIMGGMEHTTATTQTDRVLMDARAYPEFTADWLVSHELAHQWFCDLLTCKEWSHAWLNESFATYFEALFTEHDLGQDEFEYEMADKLRLYLDEDRKVYRRPIVTNMYRHPDDLFDRHLYEKGSLVLHMLRRDLGDNLFWKSIRRYVETFQGRAVETNDLIAAIQDATGRNMRKFFDQWVYGPGHPDYTVHYWWDDKKRRAHVRVSQKPVDGGKYFHVRMPIEFVTASGTKRFTETLDGKHHEYKYFFREEPLDFRFDPEHTYLKTAEISKPHRMWLKQLASDPHTVGRIDAARGVSKIKTEESVRALGQAFSREKFWGASREIALCLGGMEMDESRKFLLRSLNVRHPKVRRAVAEALGNFTDRETAKALKDLFNRDKSYFVAAESLQSLAAISPSDARDSVRKALKMESWNDTFRAAAVSTLSKHFSGETVRLAREYVRYGYQPSTRGAAVQVLSKGARAYPELFKDLYELTNDKQTRIKYAAITALGNTRDPRVAHLLDKISKDKKQPHRTRSLAEDALLKVKPSKD